MKRKIGWFHLGRLLISDLLPFITGVLLHSKRTDRSEEDLLGQVNYFRILLPGSYLLLSISGIAKYINFVLNKTLSHAYSDTKR